MGYTRLEQIPEEYWPEKITWERLLREERNAGYSFFFREEYGEIFFKPFVLEGSKWFPLQYTTYFFGFLADERYIPTHSEIKKSPSVYSRFAMKGCHILNPYTCLKEVEKVQQNYLKPNALLPYLKKVKDEVIFVHDRRIKRILECWITILEQDLYWEKIPAVVCVYRDVNVLLSWYNKPFLYSLEQKGPDLREEYSILSSDKERAMIDFAAMAVAIERMHPKKRAIFSFYENDTCLWTVQNGSLPEDFVKKYDYYSEIVVPQLDTWLI